MEFNVRNEMRITVVLPDTNAPITLLHCTCHRYRKKPKPLTWVLKFTDTVSLVPASLATCRLSSVAFL